MKNNFSDFWSHMLLFMYLFLHCSFGFETGSCFVALAVMWTSDPSPVSASNVLQFQLCSTTPGFFLPSCEGECGSTQVSYWRSVHSLLTLKKNSTEVPPISSDTFHIPSGTVWGFLQFPPAGVERVHSRRPSTYSDGEIRILCFLH